MQFNSLEFILLLLPTLMLYYILTRKAQNIFLLIVSYGLYSWWDWRFSLLLLLSTTVDYVAARLMTPFQRRNIWILSVSVVTNLLILGYFKYLNFFAESSAALANKLGFELTWTTEKILLPIGISFYTFQSISYAVDVFRGECKAEKNFLNFALFISYFPQLAAGPIERAKDLLSQFARERNLSARGFEEGAWLLLYGYFMKVVVADNLRPFVQKVFVTPYEARGSEIVIGIFAAMILVYADFQGYSSIARGLGRFMGIKLSQNFRFPLFARNPRDFWQRWHLTLTHWFRDYVYGPLLRITKSHGIALITTFVLVGFWHGAGWNFIIWGLVCGISIPIHYLFANWGKTIPMPNFAAIFLHTVWCCLITAIFFVKNLSDLKILFMNLVTKFQWNGEVALQTVALIVVPFYALEYFMEKHGEFAVLNRSIFEKCGIFAVLFLSILAMAVTDSYEFVYFQF